MSDPMTPDEQPLDLSFTWEKLRREPVYGPWASTRDDRASIALLTGRNVTLTSLTQFLTYGGLLAGRPDGKADHERQVRYAIERAEQVFGVERKAIHVLPPVLFVSQVRRERPGAEPESRTVEYLPPVCSLGRIESSMPVHDPDGDGSQLVVVWFQENFGLPDPNVLKESFSGIPWDAIAVDWSW
jgi:hypothetical protein